MVETIPPQLTPRIKHYAIKLFGFMNKLITEGSILLRLIPLSKYGIYSLKLFQRINSNTSARNEWDVNLDQV